MTRRNTVAFFLLCCLLVAVPAAALSLPPDARRDLAVLATAYPGILAAIEVAPAGRVTAVLADGARVVYDDGRPRTPRQLVDDPDLKSMFVQPYPLGPVASEPPAGFSPGRQRVLELFFALYGHDKAQVHVNLRPVRFFSQTIPFNARQGAAEAFARVTARLEKLAAADPRVTRYLLPASGGLVWRMIAGTQRLSAHAFAVAVDVSPRGNPYWRNLPRGQNILSGRQAFPAAVVAAFEAEGFIWGGKWSEFDLMHFEYRPELVLAARLARGEAIPLAAIDGLVRPGR
ncbi:MAG: M15 family metallopeptidase [Solidesulfovibrio sp. DCME]|uniref:M15 family metallopeptidase n=1 Tax=Solidesulfovibrio sp. DCME TaxID=3447380 RepID=UPI003D12106A